MKNKLIFLILLAVVTLLTSCSDDPNQSFGFILIDDNDLPEIEVLSISQVSPVSYDYIIAFRASDLSGISSVELYADNVLVMCTHHDETGDFNFNTQGYLNEIEIRLKAIDVMGKSSYSDTYLIDQNILEFEIIPLMGISNLRLLKSFANDSVWMCSNERLYQYSENGFSEMELPDISYIYDFYQAENGDFYISGENTTLYRYRNNEWQSIYSCYGTFYDITETADGCIYAKTEDSYHEKIARVLDDTLHYVYEAPWATHFYQVGTTPEGDLCYSDGENLNVYIDDNWQVLKHDENLNEFIFGDNGDFYHWISRYADSFYDNYTQISLNGIEVGNIDINPVNGLWLCDGRANYFQGKLTIIFEEYLCNVNIQDVEMVTTTPNGDIYLLNDDNLLILKADKWDLGKSR